MKERYSDLRNKTVFDFCDTEEAKDFVEYLLIVDSTKEKYIKRMKDHPDENAAALVGLAGFINDDKLKEQVYLQFKGYINRPKVESPFD